MTSNDAFLFKCLEAVTPMLRNLTYKYNFSSINMDMDDLVQEVAMLVLEKMDTILRKASPVGYVMRMVQNHMLALVLNHGNADLVSLDEPIFEDNTTTLADMLPVPVVCDDTAHENTVEDIVYRALRRLPLEEQRYIREVFQLNAYQPLPAHWPYHENVNRSRKTLCGNAYVHLRKDEELREAMLSLR